MELNQGKRFGNKANQVIPLIQSVWIFLTGSPIDSRAGEQCIGYAQSIPALWSIVIQHLRVWRVWSLWALHLRWLERAALPCSEGRHAQTWQLFALTFLKAWKDLKGSERMTNFTQCDNVCLRWFEPLHQAVLLYGAWRSAWVEWVEWVEWARAWASVRFKDWDQRTFPSTAGAALAALGLGSFSAAGHQLKRCSARWPPHQQWLSRDDGKDHLRWEEFGFQDRMKFPKQKLLTWNQNRWKSPAWKINESRSGDWNYLDLLEGSPNSNHSTCKPVGLALTWRVTRFQIQAAIFTVSPAAT